MTNSSRIFGTWYAGFTTVLRQLQIYGILVEGSSAAPAPRLTPPRPSHARTTDRRSADIAPVHLRAPAHNIASTQNHCSAIGVGDGGVFHSHRSFQRRSGVGESREWLNAMASRSSQNRGDERRSGLSSTPGRCRASRPTNPARRSSVKRGTSIWSRHVRITRLEARRHIRARRVYDIFLATPNGTYPCGSLSQFLEMTLCASAAGIFKE